MRQTVYLCFFLRYDLIHTRGLAFFSSILDFQNLYGYGLITEGNSDPVAYLNVVGRLCILPVNRYALGVTGLVGHGPALNKPRNLKEFIQTHYELAVELILKNLGCGEGSLLASVDLDNLAGLGVTAFSCSNLLYLKGTEADKLDRKSVV